MSVQVVLILSNVRTSAAHSFAVYFEHVGSQPFGSGRFVLAEHAFIRLHVGVEVPFQTPIVDSRPWAKRAAIPFFEVFPTAFALRFRCHRRRARRHH